jgi:hypothetical protein
MVAAAVIGGAVLGAGATAVAGHQAAGATKDAANTAASTQRDALSQQSALSAPYRGLGESAIPTLQGLLGLPGSTSGTPGVDPSSGYRMGPNGAISQGIPSAGAAGDPLATLRNMPGYQFQQQQGTQNTVNQASAMGLGLSGNTLEGLSKFNQGLADTSYQSEVNNLMNVTGMGQAAAAGQAQNVGNAANNLSTIATNQGNTLAGIDVNTAAGISKAVGGGVNNYIESNTLANLGGGQYGSGGTMPAGGGYQYNTPW